MIDSYAPPGEYISPPRSASSGWRGRIQRAKFLLGRYWWIIAICALIGLGVSAYLCVVQPSRYVSVARMMLNGRISMPQEGEVYSEDLMLFYGTQVALMNSSDTYEQAVARVRTLYPDMEIDPTAKVDAMQIPKTSVFELRASSTNPQYAQKFLEAVTDTYLANKRGRKDQATDSAVSAITEEISKLDSEIRSDEKQLLDFQKENDVVFIEEQSTNAANYLVELENELNRLNKESGLLNLEKERQDMPNAGGGDDAAGPASATPENPSLQQMDASIGAEQEDIAKLKILRDGLGVYLKDMHPKMIALANAIDKEQKFLDLLQNRNTAAREAYRQDLALQIKNLQAQIADANKKSLDLNQRLTIYQQLKATITREQTLYNQFASSIQNVDLSKSLDQPDVITMSPASTASLIDPTYPRQLAIGLLGGVAAGCLVIYFVTRLDNRINSPLDFEENFDLPLLGQVPQSNVDKATGRVPLLGYNDPRHIFGESNRSIRSSIIFRSTETESLRSLLITSAQPGEGKSTLVGNLAISFALSGVKVLLIDADLRKGVLHRLFSASSQIGLTEYLQGQVPWRETVQKTHLPDLHLIVRGATTEHAGDLLLSSATDSLIQEALTEYDLVLCDSAPILAADDATNLCSRLSGVVFVVRVGISPIDAVRVALEELSQRNGKIIGVVVNGVEPRQPGFRHKYQYKDYYTLPAKA